MKCQQDGTAAGNLEDGVPPEEVQGWSRNGVGLPAHHQQTLIPPPRIPCIAVVMVLSLAFHTEDPDGVGDALNIYLFTDLSPSEGLEAALLTRKWDTILGGEILGGSTLASSADMSLLMGETEGRPHRGLVPSRLPDRGMRRVLHGVPGGQQRTPCDIQYVSPVSLRLRAQARQHPTFPTSLFRLIQQDFNKSF